VNSVSLTVLPAWFNLVILYTAVQAGLTDIRDFTEGGAADPGWYLFPSKSEGAHLRDSKKEASSNQRPA
jgi:hypothetical protein